MEHMSPAQFKTLISFIRTEVREVVSDEIKKQEVRFNQIENRLDSIMGILQKDEPEIGAVNIQLDRHETRITKLEKKTF